MKSSISVIPTVFLLVSLILGPVLAFEPQVSAARTVWEDPYTLTTYHPGNEVNSTFYTFPKVIWDGSQYVDYILNSSDMSAGVGSVYIKVYPDYTIFYDPDRKEERIRGESWVVEYYDSSSQTWETDYPTHSNVYHLKNSSGIYFDRTTTLGSGAVLDEWYWLRIGSKLKISAILNPAVNGKYRLVWLLRDVSGIKARWLTTTENVAAQLVDDRSCSRIQFTSENESKCLVDWSDAGFFNKTTEKWETYFQKLEMEKDTLDNRCRARVSFGDFLLNNGESAILDPTIVTFNSTGPLDGYIEKYGASYPPSSGTLIDKNDTILGVGQYYVFGVPHIRARSYLSFNTSSVPAMAYNMNVKLRLKTSHDASTVDFTVQVMGGNQPIYGNNFTTDSWGKGTVTVATWNTASYPGDGIYINLTIPSSQINKVNNTQFELKSNRDGTNAPQPYNDEGVNFKSGDSPGNEPKLEVSYSIDIITIAGSVNVTWFYRNVSNNKVAIVLFGADDTAQDSIRIKSIDNETEKLPEKIRFLDALVQNGLSVWTVKNDSYTDGTHTYYCITSTWVMDATIWLMHNWGYKQVFLFGFSGGGLVVGNEIQEDYASRFSAAVMTCAPVNQPKGAIWRCATGAYKAKVATCFPEGVNDTYNSDTKLYYDNALVHKEWHNWTGGHDFFSKTCLDHGGENASTVVINWYNKAHRPSTPFTPKGPTSGDTDNRYYYSSGTVDPNGDNVRYQFDWNDSVITTTNWYASGTNVTASHIWSSAGTYKVTVRAQDATSGWTNNWSPPLAVTIEWGSGCPYVYTWNGQNYVKDNNLLPTSLKNNGTDVEDFYKLEQTLIPKHKGASYSLYSLQIGEFEKEHSYIDQAKLLAVDHNADVNIALTPDGQIVTYRQPLRPRLCLDNNGDDRLSEILLPDGNVSDPSTYFDGQKGSFLYLDFGKITGENAKLILRDDGKCELPPYCCIEVQILNKDEWQTVSVIAPRQYWATEAVNLSRYFVAGQELEVRLYWTLPHRLDYVGLDTTPEENFELHWATLISATHSTKGNVRWELLENDQKYAELVPGQQILLNFALPNNESGKRTFILYTEGYYTQIP